MDDIEDQKSTARRRKRFRFQPSDDISIEELFPDDMGYDADIEALHPDAYEELDSDVETTITPKKRFQSIDEELAARMKHLGSENSGTNTPITPNSMRGRKRRSLHDDLASPGKNERSDLEIVEVSTPANGHAKSPPKKRRKRSKPGSSSNRSEGSQPRNAQESGLSRVSNETNDLMDLT